MRRRDWIVAENTPAGGYRCRCLRCGVAEELRVPARLESFVLRMKAFALEHERCAERLPAPAAGTAE